MLRADLHIHSVLSPCAALEMSPKVIVETALKKNLDIIAVTDHNSTRNIEVTQQIANGFNIEVIPGVEVNTAEEIHLLAYFPDIKTTNIFQTFLDDKLPFIENKDHKFGYQLVVDENENILEEIEPLLLVALNSSIKEIVTKVKSLNGLAVPAHINRPSMSIISQLGFIPKDLEINAIEQQKPIDPELKKQYPSFQTLTSSDAHTPEQIGRNFTQFNIQSTKWDEIVMALHNSNGRRIVA